MKTPMQEFIIAISEGRVKELEYYIENEKQMIIEAFRCAYTKGWNDEKPDDFDLETAEQYYNETFKQ